MARIAVVFADGLRTYVKLDGAARPRASRGDIFTFEVASVFRDGIREAFEGPDGRNMRRTIREGDFVRQIELHVNDVYPKDIPMTTMPPTLLRLLPPLPAQLAYRIIGDALVMQDVKTNTIVDFIPHAIPGVR